jgi:glutathione S-transferase
MLKIHGVPISVHTRKVIATAIEKNVKFEVDPVIPLNPPPGFRDISPLGKIPVVTDGKFSLADSSVICAYLERLHPEPSIYPKSPQDYAQALWIEEYVDGALSQDVLGAFFQKIIRPGVLKEKSDEALIEQIVSKSIPPKLDYVESLIAGDYLVGNQFSIADITLASSLINWRYAGFPLDARRYPKLSAYLGKVVRHRSLAQALTAEAPAADSMGLDRSFLASHR